MSLICTYQYYYYYYYLILFMVPSLENLHIFSSFFHHLSQQFNENILTMIILLEITIFIK